MYRKTCYLAMLLLVFVSVSGYGQQVSQYDYTPLQINPAQAGASGEMSLMLDHRRQQYAYELTTQATAITGNYSLLRKATGKCWGGIGVSFVHEQSDDALFLKSQGIDATLAYHFTLSPRAFLSWGIQGGYYQQSLATEGVTTGSQYIENMGYNSGASTGETFIHSKISCPSLGSGLYFHTSGKAVYFGLTAYRINHPQTAFLGAAERLPVRWVAQGGKRIAYNTSWTMTPEVLWIREASRDWLRAGTTFTYSFRNDNPLDPIQSGSVDFGITYALQRAAIVSVQFNQPGFSAGFSYDAGAGTSPVQVATEMALAIKKPLFREKPRQVVKDYSIRQVRHFYEKRQMSSEKPETSVLSGNEKPGETDTLLATQPSNIATEETVAFSLKKTFEFAFNDTSLTPEAKAYFDDLAGLMKLNPELHLRIIGYTDNMGREKANLKLSKARAQTVKDYLIEQGVDRQRIQVEGRGSANPLDPNNTPAHRARNRRVELVIYK